jgi:hypothetical protein
MYRILIDTMKGKLSLVILTTTIIMVSATTIVVLLLQQQYPQAAQASPCNGDDGKEYCAGYHDGAVQAHRDFKTGDNLDVDEHPCMASEEYCNGYDRGYSDEQDFLG